MRTLLLLGLAVLHTACTSMLLGSAGGGETAPVDRRADGVAAADSSISAAIRERFQSDAELRRYGLGIRTYNGTVTLSGTVGSYPSRDRAVRIARATQGVRNVNNRIVVNTNVDGY